MDLIKKDMDTVSASHSDSKYERLLAENAILRRQNVEFQEQLSKHNGVPLVAPIPSTIHNGPLPSPSPVIPKPTVVIERKRSTNKLKSDKSGKTVKNGKSQRNKTVVRRKRLSQCPRTTMMKMEWTPIDIENVDETQRSVSRWRQIGSVPEVVIPSSFEALFCAKDTMHSESTRTVNGLCFESVPRVCAGNLFSERSWNRFPENGIDTV